MARAAGWLAPPLALPSLQLIGVSVSVYMEAWPTFFFFFSSPTDSALMVCQAKVIPASTRLRKGNKEHKATETVSGFPAVCPTNSTSRSLAETESYYAEVQHVWKQQQL